MFFVALPEASRADPILDRGFSLSSRQASGVTARKASALSARSAVAAAPSAPSLVPAASRRGALQVVAANPRGLRAVPARAWLSSWSA